jgi:hypothetical protein
MTMEGTMDRAEQNSDLVEIAWWPAARPLDDRLGSHAIDEC